MLLKLIIIEILNIYHFQEALSLILKSKVKIKDVNAYQNLFESIVQDVIKNSVKNFSISGLDNIKKIKDIYLFLIIEI